MERNTVAKILKAVRAKGGYAEKIHGNVYQPRTIDILICYRGRFLGVEAKEPGKLPTKRQRYTLEEIQRAGGIAIVAHEVRPVLAALTAIDKELDA